MACGLYTESSEPGEVRCNTSQHTLEWHLRSLSDSLILSPSRPHSPHLGLVFENDELLFQWGCCGYTDCSHFFSSSSHQLFKAGTFIPFIPLTKKLEHIVLISPRTRRYKRSSWTWTQTARLFSHCCLLPSPWGTGTHGRWATRLNAPRELHAFLWTRCGGFLWRRLSCFHGPWPPITWLKWKNWQLVGWDCRLSSWMRKMSSSLCHLASWHNVLSLAGSLCLLAPRLSTPCFHKRESLETLRWQVPFEFERVPVVCFYVVIFKHLFASSPGWSALVKAIWTAVIFRVLLWLCSGPLKPRLLGLHPPLFLRAFSPWPQAEGSRTDE